MKCFSLLPPNAPGITAEARHRKAVLAIGDEAEPLSFYHPLTHGGWGHLNAELNPICYLLALLAHHFLHVSRIRVKSFTLRLLMSYIYIYI